MTAIAGCVLTKSASDGSEICKAMLRAQPRFRRSDVAAIDGATFGRSLSLRVPEDSFDRQPVEAGERYVLVADIRLDNRTELISTLNLAAVAASRLADADVLIAAWQKWQRGSLDRIVGDYAFVIYDRHDQSLTLARDLVGQRPLFYAVTSEAWLFSSMPTGLLASGRIATGFNQPWLARKLLGFTDLSEATWLSGISRVLPGETVRISRHGVERAIHWRPPCDRLDLSDDEFVDAYDQALEEAVRSRLRRSSGRLATQLSSGFDSSAVTAAAARLSAESLPIAFTSAPRIEFKGPIQRARLADESDIAAQTAARYGLEHHIVRSSGHPLKLLAGHGLTLQEPDHNVINIDWWMRIMRAARDCDATVLLTGSMGNLTLNWGGLPVLAEWMQWGGPISWCHEARKAREKLGARWSGVLYQTFGNCLPAPLLALLSRTFQKVPTRGEGTFVQPDWLKRWSHYASDERRLYATSDLNRLRLANIHAQDSATINLAALYETGVDERDPTADRRVLEFSFRLPPPQLLKDGISRPLMRRALAPQLPEQVLSNQTRGLQAADWYEQLHGSDINDILDKVEGSAEVNALIDLKAIRSVVQNWPATNWESPRAFAVYRRSMTLALSIAVHIHEFEQLMRHRDYELIFCR